MKYVNIGQVTHNLDNKRIPLNASERARRSKAKLYPYIGANNVLDYIDDYIFDGKILCIAEDGGNWGKNEVCANIYNEKCWVNNHAHVLTAKHQVVLEYLASYLNYANLNPHITGTTRGKLTRKKLDSIEIPLPPLDDQKRIAHLLGKVEGLIARRKAHLQHLDDLLKSVFLEMFGDPVRNEKGWETASLKTLTRKIGSGATPSGGNESYKTEGISLIRSMNVHDAEFLYKDLAYIDETQAQKLKNVVVEENDVLLNITGASVCRCAIVPSDVLPARVNQHVAIIRTKKEFLNPQYLAALLIAPSYKQQLLKLAGKNGATREALTKGQLEHLVIPFPSISLQNQFAAIVEKVEGIKFRYQQSLAALETLYGALSQKAFKGELDLSRVPLIAEETERPETVA
ncbi:MAG: restriction endonuclease subunit S [Chlorobiales bacterium]|nr:restriction endonuclease subunit S [Chlorobiales bacterium]